MLMVTLYPDVAKKAQAEIDSVVGSERLPTLDDRPDLPYIDCILKEVFRYSNLLYSQIFRKLITHQESTLPYPQVRSKLQTLLFVLTDHQCRSASQIIRNGSLS